MRARAILGGAALFALAAGAVFACADDKATVRERLDGGGVVTAPIDGSTGDGAFDGGALTCGAAVPPAYATSAFTTNAGVELALLAQYTAIDAKMRSTDGTSAAVVTATDLKDLYGNGNPSLRAVSTPAAQVLVDGYFDTFGLAVGKTWTPALAAVDGGAATGGKFQATTYVSPTGLELREVVLTTILAGALYNHVLGIVAAPLSEADVDRLVAAFGATPAFADRPADGDGGPGDQGVAAYAALRGSPYTNVRAALLAMKGALAGGDACKADLDGAVARYLSEWERASFATVVHELAHASTAAADPNKGPEALAAYGLAFGFIQSFKGITADKRRILDSQIDALLLKIGGTTAYQLVTNPGDRALALGEAINDVALYEGFTAAEIDAFKQ